MYNFDILFIYSEREFIKIYQYVCYYLLQYKYIKILDLY